jgi:hypothetical protein
VPPDRDVGERLSVGTVTVKEAVPDPPDAKATVTVCAPAVGVNVQVLSALDVTAVEQAAITPSTLSVNVIVVFEPVPLIFAVIVTVLPIANVVGEAETCPRL